MSRLLVLPTVVVKGGKARLCTVWQSRLCAFKGTGHLGGEREVGRPQERQCAGRGVGQRVKWELADIVNTHMACAPIEVVCQTRHP